MLIKNFVSNKIWLFSLLVIFLVACSTGSDSAGNENEGNRLRFGLAMQPTSALVIIALEKGYFEKQGISLDIKKYPSGKRALYDGVVNDQVDLAVVPETPFALAAFEYQDLRILSSIFYSDNINRIVARQDRGILLPVDLAGKTIATQKGSAVEFFLHQFMLENQVDAETVKVKYFKAEELVNALVSGEVDVLSMREPFISRAKQKLQGQAVIFEESGIYTQIGLVSGRAEYMETHPVLLEKFLRALKLAENFARENERETISIISHYIEADPEDIKKTWRESELRVQLNQLLISINEDVARWALDQELVGGAKTIPDFLSMIYPDALESVSKNSVTLTVR